MSDFAFNSNKFYEEFSDSNDTLNKSKDLFVSRKNQISIKNTNMDTLKVGLDSVFKNFYSYNDFPEVTR